MLHYDGRSGHISGESHHTVQRLASILAQRTRGLVPSLSVLCIASSQAWIFGDSAVAASSMQSNTMIAGSWICVLAG